MLISIWRYSHLSLALVSSLFILVLSITGVILAFEPVSEALVKNPTVDDTNISVAELHENLRVHYDEILEVTVDPSGHIITSVIENGKEETFYINPLSGLKTGEIIKREAIYSVATNLHRSLFLKTPGRLLIGIFSFLLFLISITGFILFLKRQKGFKKIFSKLIRDDLFSFFHLQMSRIFFIPIILICLSGVYLSLLRFSLIPNETAPPNPIESVLIPEISPEDFAVFQDLKLTSLKKITFPFFKDPDEFFQLSLLTKDLQISQYTGEVVAETYHPWVNVFSIFMLDLHTGRSNVLWSIILGASSFSILFFLYSGFAISLKRRSGRIKNEFGKRESNIFIGVASENGSTLVFARLFQQALSKVNLKAHIFPLDHIADFKNMEHLVLFAASYGDGDPPSNAQRFIKKLETLNFGDPFNYSIVGFGSLAYPNFCGFANDISMALERIKSAKLNSEFFTINNQSFESFTNWSTKWSSKNGYPKLNIQNPKPSSDTKKTNIFNVVKTNSIEDHFLIEFKNFTKTKLKSGDLISIKPPESERPRLYSLASLSNANLAIGVKRHEMGACSHYLSSLGENAKFKGQIVENKKFHLPKTKKDILMIATGTGVTPLLGMLQSKKTENSTYLYWGIKTPKTEELYQNLLNPLKAKKVITEFRLAYSQTGERKEYVQDLITKDQLLVTGLLKRGGIIMICGSISMQTEVTKLLNKQCLESNLKPLSYYENRGQLKMDCY